MAHSAGASPRRTRVFLLLLLLLAGAYSCWTFYLGPLWADIGEIKAEHERLRQEMAVLEEKLARQPALEREWAELQEEAEKLQHLIPPVESLPLVLGNLEALLAEAPVAVESLRVGEVRAQGGHAVVTLDLTLSGGDGALFSVLESLENFVHRAVMEQVTWTRGEGGSQLALRFYFVFLPEK